MPALTVAEIAQACDGVARGDLERIIRGASALEAAGPGEISFVANEKAQAMMSKSRAGCLVVGPAFAAAGSWSTIQVADPRRAFARVLTLLYPPRERKAFIHPTAVIASSARVAADCFIGPYTVIGEESEIAGGCWLAAHVCVGERVSIGAQTRIHAHVTLYDGVRIGARVILHAGCVVGADGFGFALNEDHYEKFPQVGAVQIEDDVEIGANSCVDRAALGVTRIGKGSKLDNMVHIAHNCTVGEHVVIAAQSGFAGGVTIDDYAVVGGQVGAGEKAAIAARAIVGSGAGILSFQKIAAGEPVWGVPARPLRQHLKGLANVNRIPALKSELRELGRRVDELEKSGANATKRER
jgi:UDP-3-O-[3-hydroxymyristoyl] glucosamine N-acyltransferase